MRKRAIAVAGGAVLALFLVALPAAADTEYAFNPPSIDWRLVVILTVVALGIFYFVLEGMNRGRKDRQ